MKPIKPRIVCVDGTSLSVQADEFTYCTPRTDEGPHFEVEVGFIRDKSKEPIQPPETWREFAGGSFPSDVDGYVPVALVEEFIAAHGGRS